MKNLNDKTKKSIITVVVLMCLTSGNPVLMVLAALLPYGERGERGADAHARRA